MQLDVLTTQAESVAAPEPLTSIPDEAMRLAAKLRVRLAEGGQVVQATGLGPRDGVTHIVTLVGCALTRLEPQSVLLIDANVRNPGLHAACHVPAHPGFSDVILDRVRLDAAVHAASVPGLFVLPAGAAESDATLFASRCWADLLREARKQFRLVLIDSAPLLTSAGASLVAQAVDGVMVVMASGQRRRSELVRARRLLDELKANFLGVVLSRPDAVVNS